MPNSRIGAESLTVAKVLTDVAGGATTYDTPVPLTKKLIKVGIKHSGSMDNQYADDQTVDIYIEDGDIALDISVTDLTEDELALFFGNTMAAGVRTPDPDDLHPYFCVMWKSKKRNGAYKYYKILKVMFKEPDTDFETKQEKTTPQTDSISGIGIQRLSDKLRKRVADSEAASWVAGTGSGWFTSGDLNPDVTPPTCTVLPANSASNVVATDNIVWTFDKAIQPALVTAANFFVHKADNSPVVGVLSIGTNDTVVTFNPDASLSAGASYTSVATTGVKDKSGNAMVANKVATFAVAA